MTGITMHKFQEKWKEKLPRGGEWKVTKNTYICSKHFAEGDFMTNTQDKKKNRAMKSNCSILCRYLRKDAFPFVFPDCPQYLSTSKRIPRTSTATSPERQAIVLLREEKEMLELQRLDCVQTLGDIKNRLEENEGKSSHFVSASDKITIYAIYIYIDNEGLPTVKYTLVINDELNFRHFMKINLFPLSTRYENFMKSNRFSCFTEIVRVIDFM